MNYKICIPIEHQQKGGMFTFLASFRRWLDANGIPHTQDWRANYEVLFVNSWAVPGQLVQRVKQKRPNIKIIQRIDGSGQDYGRADDSDERQAIVNYWADGSIFQSSYSKFATMEKFKIIQKDGPIIYNPADLETFRPLSKTKPAKVDRVRVCNASFSTNRKKGTWMFEQLAKENPEVDFVLCGNYPKMPPLPNLIFKGHLGREELADVMRGCTLFAHLAQNDPCPNVVTEALASGLPILYVDSGGTPELAGPAGLPVTAENFSQQLSHLLAERDRFSQLARSRAEAEFSPERNFSEYLSAIENAPILTAPSRADRQALAAQGYPITPKTAADWGRWLKRDLRDSARIWSGRI